MKRCPSCHTQYTDITLSYCLQDGTPLVAAAESDTPTVVLNETETVAARGGQDRMQIPIGDPNAAAWQQSQVTHVASLQPEKKGSNTAIAVAITAVLMLVVFGALGIGAWLLLRNGQGEPAKNTGNPSNTSNQNPGANTAFPIPQTSPTATPAKTSGNNASIPSTPPPAVDDQQARSDVSQRINSWKSQSESLNLNAYMGHYAGTVDYYRKPGASAAFVRADKQRAFSRYSSIRVNISNMSVTTDPSGQTATAVFDKEWDFQGNGNSSGKVRQILRFRNISGQWLITAEKDLKVYYKR